MTSHEYAKKMQELAEFLLARPEFEAEGRPFVYLYYYQKEPFLAAIRAIGAGEKEWTDTEIRFKPKGIPEDTAMQIYAPRDKLCKLVRAAEYDCEPLLSPGEVEAL